MPSGRLVSWSPVRPSAVRLVRGSNTSAGSEVSCVVRKLKSSKFVKPSNAQAGSEVNCSLYISRYVTLVRPSKSPAFTELPRSTPRAVTAARCASVTCAQSEMPSI